MMAFESFTGECNAKCTNSLNCSIFVLCFTDLLFCIMNEGAREYEYY